MADVLVGTTAERGVVAILLFWETDQEPCEAVSPSGIPCALPGGHNKGGWHIGFPKGEPTLLPMKWRDGYV